MRAELERVKRALADQYDVEREIGAGGMATVYLAHDWKHGRDVAVKVLHPDLAAAVGGERFLHEIRLTAQLNHPHILSLIDSGEADGLLYYVMPYIEGESLRDRINRERQLSIDEALKIAGEVADALEHAHGKGIIHRDIKPENILLSDRHAILADFGIAHGVTEAGGERLTATGIAVGTVEYMSPEQAVGERDIDARSDLYALGCVLYEMLVGQPPFTGLNAQAITAKKTLDPVPSIRTVRDTVSQGIDASVAKALARVPADRFRTTSEFVAALAEPYVSVARVAPRMRRIAAVLGLAGMVVIGALAVLRWIPRGEGLTVLPSGSTIAVIPLVPSSPDAELTRLGRDLVTTVSSNLSNVGDIRAVNSQSVLSLAGSPGRPHTLEESAALAAQLGASSFLHGTVLRRGADAQAIVALYDTRDTTELARTSVTAPLNDVVVFADSIALEILRQIWRRGEPITPNLATTLTSSPEALRYFVRGEEAFAENRWEDAEEAYAAAYHADTTLYLASVFYNYAAQGTYSSNPVKDSTVLQAIHGHVDELPEPYPSWLKLGPMRILPTVWADSSWTDRLSALGRLADLYPDYWYIALDYADDLNHWGPLYGFTAEQAVTAWRQLLDQNPQLGPKMREAWEHGLLVSVAHDPGFTGRALEALGPIHGWTETSVRYRLMIEARDGNIDPLLVDSAVLELAGTPQQRPHGRFLYETALAGLPQVGTEISTRLLRRRPLDLPDTTVIVHKLFLPHSWAARGAWDSALAAMDEYAEDLGEMWLYRVAAAGAILGGVNPEEALRRRPDTTSAQMSRWLSRSSTDEREERGELAWLDGIVAYAQADTAGLALAIEKVTRLSEPPEYPITSLRAFQWALQGDYRRAADTLVRIQINRRFGQGFMPDGISLFMDGISRLFVSEWLLVEGDTLSARKTLRYHDRDPVFWRIGATQAVTASLALRRQAMIEEALGNDDLAIEYYREFVHRYDMPPAEHQQWVDDAKEALARLISTDPPGD